MWRPGLLAVVLALLAAAAAGNTRPAVAAAACPQRVLSASYNASVQQAVASPRDLWGERLLRARNRPTYAAGRLPARLGHAVQWQRLPLTASGSYYVPLSFPFSAKGSTVYALHVADGSEIETRVVGGPSLSVYVGSGTERFGACTSRRVPA